MDVLHLLQQESNLHKADLLIEEITQGYYPANRVHPVGQIPVRFLGVILPHPRHYFGS